MEDRLIELNQVERQLILYDIFTSFEKVEYGDIRFVLKKIEKRTLQRDVKDLNDAGLISVKYSKNEHAYIPAGEASGTIRGDFECSNKKIQHLKRLQRLTGCMRLVDDANPVQTYFTMFPECSERTRQRDFETLRHIGYEAGYDRDYLQYAVSNEYANAYDGYGVFLKNGKMVRYL